MPMVQVGQTVRDKITGFEGVVMSRAEYLWGCVRVEVQARDLKDGEPRDWRVFDEPQLEVLDVPNIAEVSGSNAPGGPRPSSLMPRPPRR